MKDISTELDIDMVKKSVSFIKTSELPDPVMQFITLEENETFEQAIDRINKMQK